MRSRAIILGAALVVAPAGAEGADLVVWWDRGLYAQEEEAAEEIVAAFEQGSGKEVEFLRQPASPEFPKRVVAALDAGRPPDFAFSLWINDRIAGWALDDRLVNLSEAVGAFSSMFDPDALDRVTVLNARTGQKALYGLPMGRSTNHVHVWKSLLEGAGFTLADIPRDWEAFWSFWCERVQPAVRQSVGRDEVWGIGLSMSENWDTYIQFLQFVTAYDADYVDRDGKLVIDDPEIRRKLISAVDGYTAIYHRGCTPPDSVTWDDVENNKQFHAQGVVMTLNETLSVPNALRSERPDDYYENTATIEWPLGPNGEVFPIVGQVWSGVVFKNGENAATAEEFVRFLLREGWLAHYLNFSGERLLPTLSKLLEQPFWLDPSDRHRMASVMQVASRPLAHNYAAASGNMRHDQVEQQLVWAKAIHRVAAEGITPEQAVDEAIARVKQILSE